MASNRVTLSILPDTADTQAEMVLDDCIHTAVHTEVHTTNTMNTVHTTDTADGNMATRPLEEVVKDSPTNQADNHDKANNSANNNVKNHSSDKNATQERPRDGVVNKSPLQGMADGLPDGILTDEAREQLKQAVDRDMMHDITLANTITSMTNSMTGITAQGMGNQMSSQIEQQLNQTADASGNQHDQGMEEIPQQEQPHFFSAPYNQNQMVPYDQQNFVYMNDGINIIDPSVYSPMVYVVEGNKMMYPNNYPFVYDASNKIRKNSSLPYAYISRNSFVKPDFNIVQNKLKLYNYWIETTNPKHTESQIVEMFGSENIYVTKSLFFRKKSSYMGEKVILISKLPQKPFKFINRINRTFTQERRSIKSVLGDYIISPDCMFIVLAERSIDYICNNYYRYHKNERLKIETLINSFKKKFTCINETDII